MGLWETREGQAEAEGRRDEDERQGREVQVVLGSFGTTSQPAEPSSPLCPTKTTSTSTSHISHASTAMSSYLPAALTRMQMLDQLRLILKHDPTFLPLASPLALFPVILVPSSPAPHWTGLRHRRSGPWSRFVVRGREELVDLLVDVSRGGGGGRRCGWSEGGCGRGDGRRGGGRGVGDGD